MKFNFKLQNIPAADQLDELHVLPVLVFRVVTTCGPNGRYKRFGGIRCLHVQGQQRRLSHRDSLSFYI